MISGKLEPYSTWPDHSCWKYQSLQIIHEHILGITMLLKWKERAICRSPHCKHNLPSLAFSNSSSFIDRVIFLFIYFFYLRQTIWRSLHIRCWWLSNAVIFLDCLSGSKSLDYSNGIFDCQSPTSPFMGSLRALHLIEDLRGVLELMDTEEREGLRCQIPDSTAHSLVEWLQGHLVCILIS